MLIVASSKISLAPPQGTSVHRIVPWELDAESKQLRLKDINMKDSRNVMEVFWYSTGYIIFTPVCDWVSHCTMYSVHTIRLLGQNCLFPCILLYVLKALCFTEQHSKVQPAVCFANFSYKAEESIDTTI